MDDAKKLDPKKLDPRLDPREKLDPKELRLPETVFSRDIENRVFQGIIVQALSEIEGIALIDGSLLDTLIGRLDRLKGIYTEQDPKNRSLKIRIELNIQFGIQIPKKAEEVQTKVIEAITTLTGMRVSEIHVVFKELLTREQINGPAKEPIEKKETKPAAIDLIRDRF